MRAGRCRGHRARQSRLPPADRRGRSPQASPRRHARRDPRGAGSRRAGRLARRATAGGDRGRGRLLVHAGLPADLDAGDGADALGRGAGDARGPARARIPVRALRRRAAPWRRRPRRRWDRLRVASTPARGCASAPPTERWSSGRETRTRPYARQATLPWFRHPITAAARTHHRLRPLVDARPRTRAQRADARFGLPVGRHADGHQAARPPGATRCRPGTR